MCAYLIYLLLENAIGNDKHGMMGKDTPANALIVCIRVSSIHHCRDVQFTTPACARLVHSVSWHVRPAMGIV